MAPSKSSKQNKKKKRGSIQHSRKQYREEQMLDALADVKRGVPVATAARIHGVPRITLHCKVTGKYPISGKPGPASILTREEEAVLDKWVYEMYRAGFPVTGDHLKNSVQVLLKKELKRQSPFKDGRPGKKWLKCFLDRHPSIRDRVAENLTSSRSSVTKKDIADWFQRTERYLREHSMFEILENPQRVFNGDETAFFLNPKGKKVLAPKGAKNVYLTVNSDEKECLTVLITANALGDLAPPMVVFKYERVPDIIAESVPDDWGMGKSENGWMTGATFYEYITKIFEPWLERNEIPRPVIFFMDGHTSHLTYHLSDFCMKNSIIMIALPPNTTHFMQPMDVSVFRSLKESWKTKVHDWRVDHMNQPNAMLKKKDFCPLLNEVLRGISPTIVKNGFRKCGLVPWDISATVMFSENTSNPAPSQPPSKGAVLQSLLILERFIGEETVKLFKESSRGTGNIEDSSLFSVWKRMRRCCFMEPARDESLNTPQGEFIVNGLKAGLDNAVYPRNATHSKHHPLELGEDAIEVVPQELPEESSTCLFPSTPKEANPVGPSTSARFEPHRLITVQAVVHNQPNTPVKSTVREDVDVEPIVHIQQITPVKPNDLHVPSPFKLSWPEPRQKAVKFRNREAMPSVVSSVDYKNYLKRKMDKKAEEEDKKKQRAEERARKKAEKEKIKLQKAAEREKKKAMIQPKKKQTRAKKPKRVLIETSSSEEEVREEWEAQDESDGNTEDEDYLEQQDNNEEMQLDYSLAFIPPVDSVSDHANDVIEVDTNASVDVAVVEETRREIMQSIGEVIGIPLPSLIENMNEEGDQREEGPKNDEGNQAEKDGKPDDYPTVEEGDYITAFMHTKKKKRRIACYILKIADGNVEAKLMKASNRMKTVFTINDEVITIEQNNIITQLPKPLVLANQRLLFLDPLEID